MGSFLLGETYLAEQIAERRVPQRDGFVAAQLQHGDCVGGREGQALYLRLQAGERGVDCHPRSAGARLCVFGTYRR